MIKNGDRFMRKTKNSLIIVQNKEEFLERMKEDKEYTHIITITTKDPEGETHVKCDMVTIAPDGSEELKKNIFHHVDTLKTKWLDMKKGIQTEIFIR